MEHRFFTAYPPPPGTVCEAAGVLPGPLLGRTVAVIGYGTMGRAQALNLRRSGIAVLVGVRDGSAAGPRASAEGLEVRSVAAAVAAADVVMLMLPDTAMAEAWTRDVVPNLRPGAAVGFAHGFAVAFGQIVPEPGRPCFLVAPKAQGDLLQELHVQGRGVPGLLAVTESSPPETWDLAAAYALSVGCLHGGGFVTTFRDECICDQFGEQTVLCGGVIELLKAAYDVMVESGYSPENAYFECVHELKLITDLLHRHGVAGLRSRISGTAAYGGLTRGPRVIDATVRQRLREVLGEIEDGSFARELLAEHGQTARLAAVEAEGPLARAAGTMLARLHPGDTQKETPT